MLFREYGMTEEEAINALTDAISMLVGEKEKDNGETVERLENLKWILEREWKGELK